MNTLMPRSKRIFLLAVLLVAVGLLLKLKLPSKRDKSPGLIREATIGNSESKQRAKLPSTRDKSPGLIREATIGNSESQQRAKLPVQYKSRADQAEYWRKHGREHDHLPDESELQNVSPKDVQLYYHSYLDNIGAVCHRTIRIGTLFDGGRRVCDDEEYRPRIPCIVYSFEMSKDFSKSDSNDIARLYGCQIHFFDPNQKTNSVKLSERVTVYRLSVGGKDGALEPAEEKTRDSRNWTTKSLTDIRSMLGHQNTILDILKLDIQGWEWIALANMASTGELDKVRQLVVRFYNRKGSNPEVTRPRLAVLSALERAGLKIFSTNLLETDRENHANVYPVLRKSIYEVSFLNPKLARTDTTPQLDSAKPEAKVAGETLPGVLEMEFLREHGKERGGLPDEEAIQSMPDKEVHIAYHSYLDNIHHRCRRKIKLGRLGDGGYHVCDDEEFRPGNPCIVYSFGIRGDFSFDDDTASIYGCNGYSFDPSMTQSNHRHSEKVTFYKMGLGGKGGELEGKGKELKMKNKWRVESLSDIKKLLGHTDAILDVVKIDIEASEWISLAHMALNGELARIRQLLMEFHIFDGKNASEVRNRLVVLKQLEKAGFRSFYTWMFAGWPGIIRMTNVYPVIRTVCYETSFVNINLARTLH